MSTEARVIVDEYRLTPVLRCAPREVRMLLFTPRSMRLGVKLYKLKPRQIENRHWAISGRQHSVTNAKAVGGRRKRQPVTIHSAKEADDVERASEAYRRISH